MKLNLKVALLLILASILIINLNLVVAVSVGSNVTSNLPSIEASVVGDKLINGTYEYTEFVFITGKPITVRGTIQLPAGRSGDVTKYTEGLKIQASDESKTVTVNRDLQFEVTLEHNKDLNQTTKNRRLVKFNESYLTPDGLYTLGKYNYKESSVIDKTFAVDYYSGNIFFERTLYLNGRAQANSGEVTITTTAQPITGYDHHYGRHNIYSVKQEIRNSKESKVWTGVINYGMSSLSSTAFEYQYTEPQNISFRGSYFKNTTTTNAVEYKYDLYNKEKSDGGLDTSERNLGENRLSTTVVTDKEALFIPKYRDIIGSYAEEDIATMTALEAFDITKEYFAPKAPISRREFAKALIIALNGKVPEFTRTDIVKRLRPGVDTAFLDTHPQDKDYNYIEFIKKNNIMNGKSGYFKGEENITRAEAIAVIMRSLGMTGLAPTPPYSTHFKDDVHIGEWAKDAIYMAYEIGIVHGTPEGYLHPNSKITKEESAVLIMKVVNHLKDTITPDYREKIIKK